MILYCTKCGINWAKLWSSDDSEEIEFCPVCNTDFFLQETDDFVGFIKCPITGRLYNAFTGQLHKEKPEYKKPVIRMVVGKPPRETIEQREERELNAINAYHLSGNQADYFQTIKKQNN